MSKIEWCDLTVNPIVGCSKISEGCQNCYAEKMAWRLKCMGTPKYQDVVDKDGWTGRLGFDWSTLNKFPKKPKRIFVGSMCDLFYEDTTYWHRQNVMYPIAANFRHTFMILTKRPKILRNFLRSFYRTEQLEPLKNLWLGITAENQKRADERTPILLQIPAAVRFVSIEPMLEEMDLTPYLHCGIDWVVIGAESGPKKRFFNPRWAEGIILQCEKAKIPVFYKQDSNQKMPMVNGKRYAQFPDSTNKMSA